MLIEFSTGFGILVGYFILGVICLLLLKRFIKMPTEVSRKTLHLILICSSFIFVYAFQTWWLSVLTVILFAATAYLVLMAGEKIKGYSELLTERKKGEVKRSAIVVFLMFSVIISLCWGLFDDKLLVLACVFAWGFGDGAAALVGKRFGKHFLEGKRIEGRKTVEGCIAMFILSFLSVLIVLLFRGGVAWYGYIITALLTAIACTFVELFTQDGFDTITCPFAAAAIIIPLMLLWGGVGV